MTKTTYLKEIQKRLPDEIIIQDETKFEYTEDEYVAILSWLKYFNEHYKVYGKSQLPEILFPIVSKRLRLDFGLYITANDLQINHGKYIIYITQNGQLLDVKFKKNLTIKELVNTWNL